ncbi:MAG TPA: mandelate racemase/muconate lactonizing enzyme family protein [Candidatus Limiplasma pullicola]|nr:mandelate racemase/muconate lactonizing enzyme family protein [Candidatus Limiplasma pullicola]
MKVMDIVMYPIRTAVVPIENGGIAPYRGSRDSGAGTTSATSALYKVTTDDGIIGWGEMNMILTLKLTNALLDEVIRPAVIGQDPFDINRIKTRVDSLYNPDINMLHFISGVEMALWDIMGKATKKPVHVLLGGAVRSCAPIAYAMGMMDDGQLAEKMAQLREEGYATIKTKGGNDVLEDIHRTHMLRTLAGDEMDIRVDMNQGYDMTQAVAYVGAVEDCRLQYVEQPLRCNDLMDYAVLRQRCRVPVAINEDCYIPGGLFNAIRNCAVDAAVVDMESIGGISELVKLAHIAQAANLPLAHHCAWDMGIKTAAIVQTVCALEALKLPIDSTYHAHAEDPLAKPIVTRNGAYVLPEGPGLGIEVDEQKVLHMLDEDHTTRYVF